MQSCPMKTRKDEVKMFKDRLKKIMEEKGLNSAAVFSMTGIGASSISQYLDRKSVV